MPITNFTDSGPPATDEDLDELEAYLGARLPPEYRAFLHRTNGGRPDPEEGFYGYRGDRSGGSLLNFFYAVTHEKKTYTLAHAYFKWEGRVPRDLLPIGWDAGGSLVCIGISGKRYGKIFFWDMEDEGLEGRPPGYRNVHLLADDMDSFLEGFFDPRELDVDDQGAR